MEKTGKKHRPKNPSPTWNRGPARPPADDAPAPDDSARGIPPDPDGRIPPDHQHDGREEGRTPEQAVIERAREQQGPPLNPDDARDEHAADK
jgi:hypothetical protein